MGNMKKAYGIGLYGNDKKVLDGTWRKMFDDEAEGPTDGVEGPPGAMFEHDEGDVVHDIADGDGAVYGGRGKEGTAEGGTKKKTKEQDTEGDHNGETIGSTKAKGKTTKAGHKREASQGTLDGMVTRTRKKMKA